MTAHFVTVAVWQTLIDESKAFHRQVQQARIDCVVELAREQIGTNIAPEAASSALSDAAERFESAYLQGTPISNRDRARLISDALELRLRDNALHELAERLGATHAPASMRPRPGAREMLRLLARRYRVVALSDTWLSPGSALRAALEHHRMAEYFTDMMFSDETGTHKVRGDAWRATAADRLHTTVGNIIHVGDLPAVDGSAAVAAGCAGAVIIDHPEHPVGSHSSDDSDGVYFASSCEQVPGLVAAIAQKWKPPAPFPAETR
ncbi:HAD family hydrolase [Nocardia rhizosphaerihabitans]|uniref:2-haloalkanoic acid dehalogenase n=1 Tax=Nocardia rhizosphaerihabitans TaxID=1691570 RepID=A0ABQ2L1Q1_9NOCA|nr:HAD family hydrolase [Nocardia rhizosphaerihabitans]GGN99396.1 2-haloalkanoic acid dehalogenase [Nocardia rhizosphaerihabitans]